ncbi:hypothetical protein [Saccharothrix violaceirubra]|uniref:Uncharacterized protein n=1 Tax=Saccharothrix violaceirubra TaxID=413306 RepID=A0A7W7TAC5_9PSEU|nr:hypothetical protein [Saccharothrix violaceirubra]MBB4969445.1 hypothetical protein [Saccharothrix violaceirubra]
MSHTTNRAVDCVLFLRDTLALSVETVPELPGLDPSVPVVVPPGVDRAAAADEWLGWWADVLDHARDASPGRSPIDPDGPSLAGRPASRAALRALLPAFAEYSARRPRRAGALPVAEVVRGVRYRLGRPVKPFRLVITVVAVRGLVWERTTATHVIASEHFLDDPGRGAPALRAIVETLA